jgi:microcystin-dependent protein
MEKYLVILIIVILFYLLYKYCIQIDNFGDTPVVPVLDANLLNSIRTLGVVAADLQSDGLKVMGDIVLSAKHALKSTATSLELRENSSNNLASMKVKNINITGTSNLTPRGMIVPWNYSPTDKNAAGVLTPPPGWALCDGTTVNGVTTPDLRNRFIYGSFARVKGSVGGLREVPLSIAQIPAHTHSYNFPNVPTNRGDGGTSTSSNRSLGLTTSSSEGGGVPHENMPPYYVLVYIMKL